MNEVPPVFEHILALPMLMNGQFRVKPTDLVVLAEEMTGSESIAAEPSGIRR